MLFMVEVEVSLRRQASQLFICHVLLLPKSKRPIVKLHHLYKPVETGPCSLCLTETESIEHF